MMIKKTKGMDFWIGKGKCQFREIRLGQPWDKDVSVDPGYHQPNRKMEEYILIPRIGLGRVLIPLFLTVSGP